MHEDRRHWTAQDLQRRASAALARAAANGVTHLRTHIDWFTAAAPDAWQEIARLDHPGISVERVALVPLGLFADPAAAEAIAQTVAEGGEGCLLGGFVHSSNWDPAAMENLLRSATRWRLDLDLHIDEELSDNPRGLAWLAEYLSRHAFPGRLCCSHGCALACGSEEQAEKILRQLAAHSVTLIALPMTNLLLQDAVTGRTPRQRGSRCFRRPAAPALPPSSAATMCRTLSARRGAMTRWIPWPAACSAPSSATFSTVSRS